MRKLTRRETVLVAAMAVAAVAGTAALLRTSPAAPPVLRPRARAEAPPPPLPRIDLARLDAAPGTSEAGKRDLFTFGARAEAPAGVAAPAAPPPRVAAPGPATTPGALDTASGAPAAPVLPPLNLRYIGSVESARGLKVAVLVTDKREVLTGQAGEVVANRYRIGRIGVESVDLEDVGTGQSRRVPLRGGS